MKTPYVHNDQPTIKKTLADLIGEIVCVSWTLAGDHERKNFEPQISVQDILEGSADTGKFRVMVEENTYTYFYDDTVKCVCQDDGKRAIVFIG